MTALTALIRLDVHAHLIPIDTRSYRQLSGLRWDGSSDCLEVDGNLLSTKALYRPQALIEWMDQHHIAHAWVSIPPTLYRQDQHMDDARDWTDLINAGFQEISEHYASRLDALFHLPIKYPALATEVARELMEKGYRRFAMPAGSASHGVMLSDAAYEPLWEALGRERTFLFVHPGRGCDGRLDRFSLQNLLSNPTETSIAAAHLSMSGICERFPAITFCLAHGGGTIAAIAGRLQRGKDTERADIDANSESPRLALRRFCVDCITHDRAALDLVAATFGADRILFGSDWPFSMGIQQPAATLGGLAGSMQQAISLDNPQRLLRRLEGA